VEAPQGISFTVTCGVSVRSSLTRGAPVDRRCQHERLSVRQPIIWTSEPNGRTASTDRRPRRPGQQRLRLRGGRSTTIRACREADLQCFAVGGRRVRHVTHRTAEEQRDGHVASLLARDDVFDDAALRADRARRKAARKQ
jgi:hypothetical protein